MDVFDFSGEKDYISDDEMEQYIKNPNIIFTEKSHTNQWWENNVFNGLEYSSIEAILDNVAIFNLCGYHSLEYKPLPNDILADNYFKLPTQSALKEHLAFLLSQKNIQIIKIWGTEWEEFLEQIEQKVKNDTVKHSNFMENISNILVVNGMNRRNKKIKNALKSPSNIEVMFKNFEKKKS